MALERLERAVTRAGGAGRRGPRARQRWTSVGRAGPQRRVGGRRRGDRPWPPRRPPAPRRRRGRGAARGQPGDHAPVERRPVAQQQRDIGGPGRARGALGGLPVLDREQQRLLRARDQDRARRAARRRSRPRSGAPPLAAARSRCAPRQCRSISPPLPSSNGAACRAAKCSGASAKPGPERRRLKPCAVRTAAAARSCAGATSTSRSSIGRQLVGPPTWCSTAGPLMSMARTPASWSAARTGASRLRCSTARSQVKRTRQRMSRAARSSRAPSASSRSARRPATVSAAGSSSTRSASRCHAS